MKKEHHRFRGGVTLIFLLFVNVNLSFSQVWDASDFSEYKTAGQYIEAYPEQQNFANYPEFSWDKASRWAILRSQDGFDTVDVRGLAKNFQLIVFEKSNPQGTSSAEKGTIKASQRLKAINPDIKTIFYWNTVVAYGGYDANNEYEPNAWEWSQHTVGDEGQDTFKVIRGFLRMFDSNVPDLRNWWVKTAANMARHPAVDGVFADKVGDYSGGAFFDENGNPKTNYIKMLDSLDKAMPDSALFLGNTIRNERWNGNREHMRYMEGSYLERAKFINRDYDQTEVEAMAVNLQLMREMATKGKLVMWKLGPGHSLIEPPTDQTKENMIQYYKDAVEYSLALYLISAEKYSYLCYSGTVDADAKTYLYLTDYIPELNRPLGEPLGPPTKDGYIYTRSFKYVDVWLNLETEECSLTWRDPIPEPTLAVTDFSSYPNDLDLKTKSSFQIGTCFSPPEAGNTKVVWNSSDTTIAVVDSNGVVTGVSGGFAVITGTSEDGSFTDETWVTVKTDLIGEIPPGINVAPKGYATQSSTGYSGVASRAIDDNINGAYTGASVTHTNSEPNPWWQVDLGADYTIGHVKLFGRTDACCAARLSNYTVRTFNADGDTTFSKTVEEYPDPYEIMETGDVTGQVVQVRLNKTGALSLAEVQVYTQPVAVIGIGLTNESATIQVEENYQLIATFQPVNATNRAIIWSSENESVATVSTDGVVTGTGVGETIIMGTSADGGFTIECSFTVTGIPVVSIGITSQNTSLYVGDSEQLTATFNPNNASNKLVSWESGDTNIAIINNSGLVTAKNVGSVIITATSNDGGFTATYEIIVKGLETTGVTVYPNNATLYAGYTKQLTATVSPENATNQNVNWDSDNLNVALVDSVGLVTAISAGTATIKATTEDGDFTDECVFTISFRTGIDQMNDNEPFDWQGASVEIYNIVGMLVYKQVVTHKSFVPDLNVLPQGTYIVVGKNKGDIITKKIIKPYR